MHMPRDVGQITEIGWIVVVQICLAAILVLSAGSKAAATAAPSCQAICLQQRSSCYAAIPWREHKELIDQRKPTCISQSNQCLVGCLR
jgi:hypothetical protein